MQRADSAAGQAAEAAKVFGKFLKDGEDTHFYREDFAGILKDEYLPDWAREKLNELQPPEEPEGPGMMM